MRLDKYLKMTRIIKRRTLSKDLILLNRVLINGKIAKPASIVKTGDILDIDLRDLFLRIKVEMIKENIRKEEADTLYSIIEELNKTVH